jgi:hypothetical protein
LIVGAGHHAFNANKLIPVAAYQPSGYALFMTGIAIVVLASLVSISRLVAAGSRQE